MTRRKRWFRAILVSVTLLLAGLFFLPAPMNATTPDDLDENRARLLTYVLRRQVENHFSGKSLDDNLSRAAFQLYVKQLDYQKRLLLAAEVDYRRWSRRYRYPGLRRAGSRGLPGKNGRLPGGWCASGSGCSLW